MIFEVGFEMRRQIVDTLRQDGDLDKRRAAVLVMDLVAIDDCLFLSFGDGHGRTRSPSFILFNPYGIFLSKAGFICFSALFRLIILVNFGLVK